MYNNHYYNSYKLYNLLSYYTYNKYVLMEFLRVYINQHNNL
nr:MAG TPA: hypothetical protein [Caudoviricetes sp.]DAW87819.1 MAG TPA: hypothetical protein [Caudoviricetes sp.]